MARIKMLDKLAMEEGTYSIKFSFYDEVKNLTPPTSLSWWLTDVNGVTINGRSEVAVESPTSPWTLTLSGPDLQLTDVKVDYDIRVVTLKGLYNSDIGINLPLTYAVMFKVKNLFVIARPIYLDTTEHIFTGDLCSVQV